MTISGEQLEGLYTTMVKIRRFDEKTVELFHPARQGHGAQLRRRGGRGGRRLRDPPEGDYIVGTTAVTATASRRRARGPHDAELMAGRTATAAASAARCTSRRST